MITAAPEKSRPPLLARAVEMAKAHRNVSLKVGYTMPMHARQSRHLMRLYALQARGKTPTP